MQFENNITERVRLILMNDQNEYNETLNQVKGLYQYYIIGNNKKSVFTPKESFIYCMEDYLKEEYEKRIYDLIDNLDNLKTNDQNGLMLIKDLINVSLAYIDYKKLALNFINTFLENENIKL
jgi:hypothetical protein